MIPFKYVSLFFVSFLIRASLAGFKTTKIGPKPLWNATMVDKLRRDLLLNYDKFARPEDYNKQTTVEFNIDIQHIELNELKQIFTVHAWVDMTWTDAKLQWNESDYDGISRLHFAEHEIWQPDLFLYNSASGASINHYGNTHCIAQPTGKIVWAPPAQLTTFCQINLKYWPFDTQVCSLLFGSWTYNGEEVDLAPLNNDTKPKLGLLIENSEWEITDTSLSVSRTNYACCIDPYVHIEISITMKRISPSYKAVIIAPTFVIVLLTLACFWLPPQSGEKIVLNSCNALIITLLMMYFSQKLPAMGNHTPILVLFYSCSLYIVTLSTIGSIVVILISRTKHTKNIPWYIKWILTGTTGKILFLHNYIEETPTMMQNRTSEELRDTHLQDFDIHSGDEHLISRSHSFFSNSNKENTIQREWLLLAAAIDRFSFCFYSVVFAVLAIVYSV